MSVKYISSENNGFGFANNLGVQEAQGKLLLFLNPDTYLIEPILKNIINTSNKHRDYSVFILNQLNEKLRRQISFYFLNKNGLLYSLLIKFLNKMSIFVDGLMFGSGASFGIYKEVFLKIGGFDENLFLYYEEPDLFRRLSFANYKSKFLFKSRIVHIGSTSTNNIELKTRHALDSEIYYYNKYNLNFNKNLRDKIKYNKFKLLIYNLLKNEQKVLEISKINKLLTLELEKSVQTEYYK
jgi:GT2 family glycosyltransferase